VPLMKGLTDADAALLLSLPALRVRCRGNLPFAHVHSAFCICLQLFYSYFLPRKLCKLYECMMVQCAPGCRDCIEPSHAWCN